MANVLSPTGPYSGNLTKAPLKNEDNGKNYLDIYNHLRQIVFDLTLSLNYGAKSGSVDDSFTNGSVVCINQISFYRASTRRIRDYSPILRFLVPSFTGGNAVREADKAHQKHL